MSNMENQTAASEIFYREKAEKMMEGLELYYRTLSVVMLLQEKGVDPAHSPEDTDRTQYLKDYILKDPDSAEQGLTPDAVDLGVELYSSWVGLFDDSITYGNDAYYSMEKNTKRAELLSPFVENAGLMVFKGEPYLVSQLKNNATLGFDDLFPRKSQNDDFMNNDEVLSLAGFIESPSDSSVSIQYADENDQIRVFAQKTFDRIVLGS